ncbi:serine hydrolase [Neptunicella sp. SCSIO 80796]|uniref:serine hydrolase n=1 Tax=Neptunicella plasticusilytica TaxID=3117012 RepID=UPI003A4D90CF
MRKVFLGICLLLPLSLQANQATPLTNEQIDQVAQRVMQEFSVPGAAVGVVYQGKVVHAKGYGVKNINQPEQKIDRNSLFKIASNTKAFTAAALAILVDEGKIRWDDKVVKYLPDFKLHDAWITEHFIIKDLLTHRSGLGLGAGDLMIWPKPSSFSRQEVIHNLRYLKPAGEFRASYAYDNLLYIVAGELIPAITGLQWEDFVEQRIMQPLGMQHCFAGKVAADKMADMAKPHGIVEGQLQLIERPERDGPAVSSAAGGIKCSLNDMLIWLQLQLDEGRYAGNKQLFSVEQHQAMWSSETIMPVYNSDKRRNNTHFSTYGLGWRLNDVNGYLRVHHTGSLAGMYSYVSFFPELDLGIVVMLNQQSSNARSAMMYAIMKSYLPVEPHDWIAEFIPQPKSSEEAAEHRSNQAKPALYHLDNQHKLTDYAGRYQDPWLGIFSISLQDQKLVMSSERVTQLVGKMSPVAEDKFLVKWNDRSLEADVFAIFNRDDKGQIKQMLLLPESEDIDFSYDFQDLDFKKLP